MASAIIVAAGKGRRMEHSRPKQYLRLDGIPILSRTLTAFADCPSVSALHLVLPENDFEWVRQEILSPISLDVPIKLVAGGPERQDSVYNGLISIAPGTDIVAIHDGVRPLVAPADIEACIRRAEETGACILALPAVDTLKTVDGNGVVAGTLDRAGVWIAQTPQAFRYDWILEAHELARQRRMVATDDAQLLEHAGKPVTVVTGSRFNIKITDADDLKLARAILHGNHGNI